MTPHRAQELLFAFEKDGGQEAIFMAATQSEVSWIVSMSLAGDATVRTVLLATARGEELAAASQ